jgi:hypothetical protein
MGLFNSLFSMTGPAKMMAAQNALIAKFMVEQGNGPSFEELEDEMQGLLMSGGMEYEESVRVLGDLDEKHIFLFTAAAYNKLFIPPALKGICFRDNWNFIERPLIALNDADKEISMVISEIFNKYGIHITFEC